MLQPSENETDFMFLPTVPADFAKSSAHIGFVILATDRGIENELRHIVPDGVSFHTSRAPPYSEVSSSESLADIRRAASLMLSKEPLEAIAYACSSGSFILDERLLIGALNFERPDVLAVTVKQAVIAAIGNNHVSKISLLTPYDRGLTALIIASLRASGITTVKAGFLELKSDDEIASLSPRRILESALALDCPQSEAIVILCNALQTWSVVPEIAHKVGKPVIGGTQSLVEMCIRFVRRKESLLISTRS
ncbi:hypothetical protein HB780_00080 (plasmid) [Rhizobium lusitanum]|uniref:maleate cis-trans isomerase family protein n=1 Tax=Rhizobium lusitanum TaxID=293958 RepID=UPI00160D46F3|nr:hypothetical protein [Rhizobium lusitanum]QND44268.1 hypothetical protein HB780_00080 [Rhizobium lusitanum]